MADTAQRDPNFIPTIQGVSSVDFSTPTNIAINPQTKAVLIETTKEIIPTQFDSSQKNVTTAGTAVQLPPNPCLAMTIKAKSTNTGLIYVGKSNVSSSNGHILSAGEPVDIVLSNTNKVWIDASVSGEGVSFAFVNT